MFIINLIKKTILIYGAFLILAYLFFRIQLINLSPVLVIFSILLFIAELHTITHFIGMIYSLWPRKYVRYININYDRNLTVNFFICVCGEPRDIVRKTIMAAKKSAETYTKTVLPHLKPRIIVLNDGFAAKKDTADDIKRLCAELRVYHIARKTSDGFKAGNINNGLAVFSALNTDQTIDIVLDADFSVVPEFLTEITKPFVDKSVDFVQTPQRYKNEVTWVAKAAAAHQIYFFDYICDAKAYDNALFLCGTNFAIRRSALLAVGGMDTRFITEDYATSLNLHMSGKKGVFIRKPLAYGIAPSSLKAYFSQQKRWSKGTFDTSFAYLRKIIFGPLTIKQKMHYLLSASYYLIGLRDCILMLAPLPYLFFGVSLIRQNTLTFLTLIYGPMLIYNFILYLLLFKEPVKSLVLDLISFPIFAGAFLQSLFGHNLGFVVTIKKYEKEHIFKVYKTQLEVILLLIIGLIVSTHTVALNATAAYINYFWATFDVLFLTLGFYLIVKENYLGVNNEINLSRAQVRDNTKVYFPVKYIIAPILAVLLLFIVYQSPFTKSIITRDLASDIIAQAQGKKISEELIVPGNGAYYGYYLPELDHHPLNPTLSIIPEEKPSLAMFYQDWGNRQTFDTDFISVIERQNVIPVLTWEPWDIQKTKDGNDYVQKEYAPKVIASGSYDDFIHSFARQAADYGKPFFLRFAHEMNGNWYPWGVQAGNDATDYIKMWRHVHDIFAKEGATNVIWVWSPNNTDADGNSDTILSYYPGSDYVDWVAFSGFNWGQTSLVSKWTPFRNLAYDAYNKLITLNKPIMVAETSSASYGGDKTTWFMQTLKSDIPNNFPMIKAIIFFHDDSRGADFSLGKNMETYKVIHEGIMENDYYRSTPLLIKRTI
jgi:cellulose synthase (UDP-forming)